MTLRTHQAETARLADAIADGAPIRTICESVTPGGGKSALPGILADRLFCRIADRILWIVPRNSLRDQGESDFPEWSRFRVRAAGNETDPCRGVEGYVTTYQAIVADPRRHLANLSDSRRWILFMDEPHHVLAGGAWDQALAILRSRLSAPIADHCPTCSQLLPAETRKQLEDERAGTAATLARLEADHKALEEAEREAAVTLELIHDVPPPETAPFAGAERLHEIERALEWLDPAELREAIRRADEATVRIEAATAKAAHAEAGRYQTIIVTHSVELQAMVSQTIDVADLGPRVEPQSEVAA